jgi:hypothetical protein
VFENVDQLLDLPWAQFARTSHQLRDVTGIVDHDQPVTRAAAVQLCPLHAREAQSPEDVDVESYPAEPLCDRGDVPLEAVEVSGMGWQASARSGIEGGHTSAVCSTLHTTSRCRRSTL